VVESVGSSEVKRVVVKTRRDWEKVKASIIRGKDIGEVIFVNSYPKYGENFYFAFSEILKEADALALDVVNEDLSFKAIGFTREVLERISDHSFMRIDFMDRVAIVGYGNMGKVFSKILMKSGARVRIYVPRKEVAENLKESGYTARTVEEFYKDDSDFVVFAFPDERHVEFIEKNADALRKKALVFLCGFTPARYPEKLEIEESDVLIFAPKVIASRLEMEDWAAVVGVEKDRTGFASDKLKWFMAALKPKRAFHYSNNPAKAEAVVDLSTEALVLCGGVFYLIKAVYDELVRRGYNREHVWEEVFTELRYIVQAVEDIGIEDFWKVISSLALKGAVKVMYEFDRVGIKDFVARYVDTIEENLEVEVDEVVLQRFKKKLSKFRELW